MSAVWTDWRVWKGRKERRKKERKKIKKKERKKERRKLCCHCSEPCNAGSTLELHVGRWDERGMDRLESVEGQEGKKKERKKENKKERKKERRKEALLPLQ